MGVGFGGFLDSVCTIYDTLNIWFDTISLCSLSVGGGRSLSTAAYVRGRQCKSDPITENTIRPSRIVIRNSRYTKTAASFPPPPPLPANTITRTDSNTSMQSPTPRPLIQHQPQLEITCSEHGISKQTIIPPKSCCTYLQTIPLPPTPSIIPKQSPLKYLKSQHFSPPHPVPSAITTTHSLARPEPHLSVLYPVETSHS